MRRRPMRRTWSWCTRRPAASSIAPFAPSSLKRKIRTDPERRAVNLSSAGRSSTSSVTASTATAITPATRPPRPDVRHGAEPGARPATRILARRSREGTRHQPNTGRSLGRELAHSHGIDFDRTQCGLGNLDPSDVPRRSARKHRCGSYSMPRRQLHALSCQAPNMARPAGRSTAMQTPERIIRLKTVLARTGCFPPTEISTNGAGWGNRHLPMGC